MRAPRHEEFVNRTEHPGTGKRHSLLARLGERLHMLMLWIRHPGDVRRISRLLESSRRNGMRGVNALAMMESLGHVTDLRVNDIMVPRSQMIAVSHDMDLTQILAIVIDSGHSRFPVIGDDLDDVRGVLLAKDLLRCLVPGDNPDATGCADYVRPQTMVPKSKRLDVLLDEFRKNRSHMAMVVDEYGGTAGLVTIEDVLEQIVGDISDEHDVTESEYIYDRDHGHYSVKALTPLEFFNRYFECDLRRDGVDTVGGVVIEALGHVPQRGEEVAVGDFLFEVVTADSRRVHLLAVRRRTT